MNNFIDGSCEIEYTEHPRGFFDDYEKKKIIVEIGGAADMGQIFVDGECILTETKEFFVALREVLNNLWQE